jgi:hypothetical protein
VAGQETEFVPLRVSRCFGGTYRGHVQGQISQARNQNEADDKHVNRCEEVILLRPYAVSFGRKSPTFQRSNEGHVLFLWMFLQLFQYLPYVAFGGG